MRKKALFTVLTASLMCAVAAVAFAACREAEPTLIKYKVTYEGGAAAVTGTAPKEADHAKDEKFKLQENTFENAGYEFSGWKYGGQTLEAGAEFTMPDNDVTFTATWTAVSPCTVTYELGEGVDWAGEAPATTVLRGAQITLPAYDAAEKTNSEIYGWTIGGQNYEPGATYTVNGDVTVTAVWGAKKYAVSYMKSLSDADSVSAGRFIAGTEIDLAAPPEDWVSETKEFVGWVHRVYNEATQTFDEITYEAGAKFTVPANDVILIANITVTRVSVKYYLNREESFDPTVAPWKSDSVTVKDVEQYAPYTGDDVEAAKRPDGCDFLGWFIEEDEPFDPVTHIREAVVHEKSEVMVYGQWGKAIVDFTSDDRTLPHADTIDISYGQTVTLTGNMIPAAKGENGEHVDSEGIFLSVGKTEGAPVSVMMLYNNEVLNIHNGEGIKTLTHAALGIDTALAPKLFKFNVTSSGYEEIAYSTSTVATMLGGTIANFKAVADYTDAGKLVVTTSFTSVVGAAPDTETYYYEGVATHTAVYNPHKGLAQTYRLAVCGEAGSRLENGTFKVDGKAKAFSAPVAEHNYVNGVCTICGVAKQTIAVGNTNYTLDLAYPMPAVNTAKPTGGPDDNGWFSGEFGKTNVPDGNFALRYRYTRQRNSADAVIQLAYGDSWGTCELFGNADDWQTGNFIYENYTVTTTVNGETAEQPAKPENGDYPAGFWFGDYTVTIIRDGQKTLIVCDFVRMKLKGNELVAIEPNESDYYHLVEIYETEESPTDAGFVQLSGWCADLTGTVALGTFTK